MPHARRRDRAPLGQKIEAVEGVVPAGVASSVAPPLVIPFGMKPNLNNLTSNDSNQQQARGTSRARSSSATAPSLPDADHRTQHPLDADGQSRDLPGSGATLLHVMWPLTPAGRQHLA